MPHQELKNRGLPQALRFSDGRRVAGAEDWEKRREEIKELLCREEYGFLPPKPRSVTAQAVKTEENFCAGKASLTTVRLTAVWDGGEFSFLVYCTRPYAARPCPAFVFINFRDGVPDRYLPAEEVVDSGFAVFSFCYQDITSDDGDMTNGLAKFFCADASDKSAPGKIALWAWAAMRVMDYVQTLETIDRANVAVMGHSRLGKTALLAGAMDERFAFVISNDSGCGGAALSRGKGGERIADITARFPFWFCENYLQYRGKEETLPFDQHFLLSLVFPRGLYVASAEKDAWADPRSEFLACVETGKVYEALGAAGLVHSGRWPVANEWYHEGSIGYHMRAGTHYLSRCDWSCFMRFVTEHRN
ncbi:MAG: alpha/beta hydrolase [Oscillospiraceae bacterium]|nr:alpha/beta hydrolase [Oscillospiraceae bacterium]